MSLINSIQKVVIIGCGNVGTQLAYAIDAVDGLEVVQVYNRSIDAAKELGELLQCYYTNQSLYINLEADIYLITLKDDVLEEFLNNTPTLTGKLLVHTSGSLPLSILNSFTGLAGVFYPLQTISKSRNINFQEVPLLIEGSTVDVERTLCDLALKISDKVSLKTSTERQTLHLAAVFVNNFVNHLFTISAEYLQQHQLDFELLKPLINETIHKIQNISPDKVQTGPAKRNDQNITQKHLTLLDEFQQQYPELKAKELYRIFSESITNFYQYRK